jgi:heme-degrading monooxygenase HmoA
MKTIEQTIRGSSAVASTQYVMASRLRLSSVRHLPAFLRASARVNKQAKAAPGHLGSRLRAQFGKLTFWTLSAWEDEAAMTAFVRTAPHTDAMRDLRDRGAMRSGEFRSWDAPSGTALPSWDDVAARFPSAGG